MKHLGRLTLVACAGLAATPLAAQSLAVGAGIVKPSETGETSLFLTANIRLKLLGPIHVEPEVGYWKDSQTALAGQVSSEDLSVGANALLVIPGRAIEVFGGAGLGLHFLDRSGGVAGLPSRSDQTKTALQLFAGLDVKLSDALSLFGAGRYDVLGRDDPDEELHQKKLYGGLRLRF
jgi:opacity protein-like surface antigen